MRIALRQLLVIGVVFAVPCLAQKSWEMGGSAGYGFSLNGEADNSSGKADTGIKHGIFASAYGGNHLGQYFSGEVRYTYRVADLFVSQGGAQARFNGDTHTVHYDVLVHTNSRENRLRPYFAFGGGIRIFRGTDVESAFQPLSQFVLLTLTDELKPMLSLGGGVRYAMNDWMDIRFDFRDYLTQFPTKVIQPVPGVKVTGWLHDFLPMGGIGIRF